MEKAPFDEYTWNWLFCELNMSVNGAETLFFWFFFFLVCRGYWSNNHNNVTKENKGMAPIKAREMFSEQTHNVVNMGDLIVEIVSEFLKFNTKLMC